MALYEANEENYIEIMEKEFDAKNVVLLQFGSELCDACMALETELEQLDDNMDNLSIIAIDGASAPEVAESFDVYQLPAMVIYKDRETTIYQGEGVILCEDIQKMIESAY